MPLPGLTGSAADDLGLGGMLQGQVAGETDEERKRRIAQANQQRLAGMGGTPATQMLFGGGAPGTGGYR